jgi:4-hydroxybenzoate polyprenyltransferase
MADLSPGERANPDASGTTAGLRERAAAYAALVRVPNTFTAPPDVLAGAALAAAVGAPVAPAAVAAACLASLALYAAGTTLNDWADAERDARERPERPIPSGRVSRRGALGLGLGLVVLGVTLAAVGAGPTAGAAAGLVAAAVLAYDGGLKDGPAGFLAMGLARGFNVVLGLAAAGVGVDPGVAAVLSGPLPVAAVPVAATLYVAALTAMAERETAGSGADGTPGARRAVALVGLAAVLAGAAAVGASVAYGDGLAVALSALLAGWFLVRVGRPLRTAYADPAPDTVGPAVGACVLSLVVLDAAVAASGGVGFAAAALAFLVPATVLSGLFEVS